MAECEDCKNIFKATEEQVSTGNIECPKCHSKKIIVHIEHRPST